MLWKSIEQIENCLDMAHLDLKASPPGTIFAIFLEILTVTCSIRRTRSTARSWDLDMSSSSIRGLMLTVEELSYTESSSHLALNYNPFTFSTVDVSVLTRE